MYHCGLCKGKTGCGHRQFHSATQPWCRWGQGISSGFVNSVSPLKGNVMAWRTEWPPLLRGSVVSKKRHLQTLESIHSKNLLRTYYVPEAVESSVDRHKHCKIPHHSRWHSTLIFRIQWDLCHARGKPRTWIWKLVKSHKWQPSGLDYITKIRDSEGRSYLQEKMMVHIEYRQTGMMLSIHLISGSEIQEWDMGWRDRHLDVASKDNIGRKGPKLETPGNISR